MESISLSLWQGCVTKHTSGDLWAAPLLIPVGGDGRQSMHSHLHSHRHTKPRNHEKYRGLARDGDLMKWRAGDWAGLLDPDMELKFSEFQPSSSRDKEPGGQRRASADIAQALALVR